MELIEKIFGNNDDLLSYQMAARAFVIFFISLLLIRLGGIRILGRQSAFDVLTALMLGAIMGRAIISGQSIIGTIVAGTVIVLLHRLMAWITFINTRAGKVIKGKSLLLMKDGKKQLKNLSKSYITEEDIMTALRCDANVTDIDKIKEVYLERSGDISIIKE